MLRTKHERTACFVCFTAFICDRGVGRGLELGVERRLRLVLLGWHRQAVGTGGPGVVPHLSRSREAPGLRQVTISAAVEIRLFSCGGGRSAWQASQARPSIAHRGGAFFFVSFPVASHSLFLLAFFYVCIDFFSSEIRNSNVSLAAKCLGLVLGGAPCLHTVDLSPTSSRTVFGSWEGKSLDYINKYSRYERNRNETNRKTVARRIDASRQCLRYIRHKDISPSRIFCCCSFFAIPGAVWSPFSPGQLLSFSGDGTARVLDINSPAGAGVVVRRKIVWYESNDTR